VGRRSIRLVRASFPGRAAFDTAVSRALLVRAAAGEAPETLRLYSPDAVLAFGPRDRLAPGFRDAVRAARGAGFEPVLRLAGGRAAVFHERTLAFGWTIPDPASREHVHERFADLAAIMAEAFRALGVDARVGEVPGEYCPGSHSVNARGERKLMGVGQRVVSGAAHVGGVVVVSDAARVNAALDPVYRALALDWRPEATGSLADEVGALTLDAAAGAILEAFAARHDCEPAELDPATLARAADLEPEHRPDA
jgi:lipoate-protein ligase A